MGLEPYAAIAGLIAACIAIFSAVSGRAIWLYSYRNAERLVLKATIKENPVMVELKARAMRTNKEMRLPLGNNHAGEETGEDIAPPWPYLYVTARNTGSKDQIITGVFVDGLQEEPLQLKPEEFSDQPLAPDKERAWKVAVNPALADRISRIYAVVESERVWRISRRYLREIRKGNAICPRRASRP
jgi:hypothetical protein